MQKKNSTIFRYNCTHIVVNTLCVVRKHTNTQTQPSYYTAHTHVYLNLLLRSQAHSILHSTHTLTHTHTHIQRCPWSANQRQSYHPLPLQRGVNHAQSAMAHIRCRRACECERARSEPQRNVCVCVCTATAAAAVRTSPPPAPLPLVAVVAAVSSCSNIAASSHRCPRNRTLESKPQSTTN